MRLPTRSTTTEPPLARTISSIAPRGIANSSSPTEKVSAGMMVSVIGTRSVSRQPRPICVSISTVPPIRSTLARTTSMPTPRPEIAVTCVRGRQPRGEDQLEPLGARHRRGSLARHDPGGDRLLDEALVVDAAAVVGDLDQYLVARLARIDAQRARGRLGGALALGGHLDAMIDRVADDMGQRIADHLDHLAIELDVAAVDHQHDLLVELGRQIAHHPRQRGEQPVDALHPGTRDRFAHLGDAGRQPLERGIDVAVAGTLAQPA